MPSNSVELNIYEPPRFFEAFLRGRHHGAARTSRPGSADLSRRLPVSACNAIEDACGVTSTPRLGSCAGCSTAGNGSQPRPAHPLLHAPDFLGHPDVSAWPANTATPIERGLALKKAGIG